MMIMICVLTGEDAKYKLDSQSGSGVTLIVSLMLMKGGPYRCWQTLRCYGSVTTTSRQPLGKGPTDGHSDLGG